MIGIIETLEGRTLLSAAVGDAAPDAGYEAAQAHVERIQAAQSSAAENRQAFRDALKASRVAIRQIVTDAQPLLKEDFAELRAARTSGDAARLDAARARLAADRSKVKADITAAKDALKDDLAGLRDQVKGSSASLDAELRALRDRLRQAAPGQKANIRKLIGDLRSVTADSGVTRDDVRDLLRNIYQGTAGAVKPSETTVEQLRAALRDALADDTITADERASLLDTAEDVLASANVSAEERQKIRGSVENILDKLKLSDEEIRVIVGDVKKIIGDAWDGIFGR
jgi:hypothetical protein